MSTYPGTVKYFGAQLVLHEAFAETHGRVSAEDSGRAAGCGGYTVCWSQHSAPRPRQLYGRLNWYVCSFVARLNFSFIDFLLRDTFPHLLQCAATTESCLCALWCASVCTVAGETNHNLALFPSRALPFFHPDCHTFVLILLPFCCCTA